MRETILAIDPATRTGWALASKTVDTPWKIVESGTWNLAAKKLQNPSIRFLNLRRHLSSLADRHAIDNLVYENPGSLHGHARKILPGLQAIIESWCLENGVNWSVVRPGPVKKFATGSGTAQKEEMLTAARLKWPEIEIKYHDHADALWILSWYLSEKHT